MKRFKLGELIEIHNGTTYKHLSKGDIPLYGSGGIMSYVDNYLYDGEAVLLPRKGTLDNIMYVNGKIWTVDTMYYATTDKRVDPYYLYCYLSILNLKHLDSGSALPSMTKSSYNDIIIQLPEIETQRRIAKVLSDLDAKIDLNNRINSELEGMAKLIYDYWFVQFDFPISEAQAAAMGRPELKGKPYKSSGGKMVFNEELKREVPEGWEVKDIREIASTGSGGTPLRSKAEFYENGDIPWINSGELNAPFIVNAAKYITPVGLKNSSAKLFKKGTLLLAMYGATAGKVSLLDIEACTNQAICAIIPHDKRLTTYFKFGFDNIYDHLINLSTGSARDNLSQDKVKDLIFAIPDESVLSKFDKISSTSFRQILMNLREINELSSLRDWLLPMLMNGQVQVMGDDVGVRMAAEPGKEYGKSTEYNK